MITVTVAIVSALIGGALAYVAGYHRGRVGKFVAAFKRLGKKYTLKEAEELLEERGWVRPSTAKELENQAAREALAWAANEIEDKDPDPKTSLGSVSVATWLRKAGEMFFNPVDLSNLRWVAELARIGEETLDRRIIRSFTWVGDRFPLYWRDPDEKYSSSEVVGYIDRVWEEGTGICAAGVITDPRVVRAVSDDSMWLQADTIINNSRTLDSLDSLDCKLAAATIGYAPAWRNFKPIRKDES